MRGASSTERITVYKFKENNAAVGYEVSLVRYLQKSLERLELGKFSVEWYHYPLFLEIAYPTLLTEGGHEYYLVGQGKSNAIDQCKTRTSTDLRKPTFVLRGIPEDDVCDMLSIKEFLDACLLCSRTGKNVRGSVHNLLEKEKMHYDTCKADEDDNQVNSQIFHEDNEVDSPMFSRTHPNDLLYGKTT
ncbi:hypothetical protein ACFE04_022931 [Oxalis oulophora]